MDKVKIYPVIGSSQGFGIQGLLWSGYIILDFCGKLDLVQTYVLAGLSLIFDWTRLIHLPNYFRGCIKIPF